MAEYVVSRIINRGFEGEYCSGYELYNGATEIDLSKNANKNKGVV